MKPKMYRKTKPSSGSNMATFKANSAGGPVALVTNPPTATGQTEGPCISRFSVDQGNSKGIGTRE